MTHKGEEHHRYGVNRINAHREIFDLTKGLPIIWDGIDLEHLRPDPSVDLRFVLKIQYLVYANRQLFHSQALKTMKQLEEMKQLAVKQLDSCLFIPSGTLPRM